MSTPTNKTPAVTEAAKKTTANQPSPFKTWDDKDYDLVVQNRREDAQNINKKWYHKVGETLATPFIGIARILEGAAKIVTGLVKTIIGKTVTLFGAKKGGGFDKMGTEGINDIGTGFSLIFDGIFTAARIVTDPISAATRFITRNAKPDHEVAITERQNAISDAKRVESNKLGIKVVVEARNVTPLGAPSAVAEKVSAQPAVQAAKAVAAAR